MGYEAFRFCVYKNPKTGRYEAGLTREHKFWEADFSTMLQAILYAEHLNRCKREVNYG